MSSRPFRFVHASDFHLEQPAQGLAEVPDHLRELFIESPYRAAERVIETVLAEEADLLVLGGDILHPQRTGPRGLLFLVEQFGRLAERQIPVYWSGGRVDPPDHWPAAIRLPDNVHVFARGRVTQILHEREGLPLARLVGMSLDRAGKVPAGQFDPDPAGLFTIAVVHGPADAAALSRREIDYWALGGRHNRRTLFNSPHVAHYPGSCQGRCPDEHGAHGCSLVQVDEQRRIRTSLLPTDVMRWLNERVVIDESSSREDLEALLRDRMEALVEMAAAHSEVHLRCPTDGRDLLVAWTVAGCGPLVSQLRQGRLAEQLLEWLRAEYGGRSSDGASPSPTDGKPAAWSVSIEVEPTAALPPEWYDEETIRGDFLRAVRQLQVNPDTPLELEQYLGDPAVIESLGPAHLVGDVSSATHGMAAPDNETRQRVLREAALLGAELLSGEEP